MQSYKVGKCLEGAEGNQHTELRDCSEGLFVGKEMDGWKKWRSH